MAGRPVQRGASSLSWPWSCGLGRMKSISASFRCGCGWYRWVLQRFGARACAFWTASTRAQTLPSHMMSMWVELIPVVGAPVSKRTHQGNPVVHGLQRSLAVWCDALKLQWHDGGASQPIPVAWFALENDCASLTGSTQRARSRRPSVRAPATRPAALCVRRLPLQRRTVRC